MAQYDVFEHPEGNGFLLDVQSDLLDDYNIRVVVPLLPQREAPLAASRLNPAFSIEGKSHLMMTQYLSSVPETLLKAPVTDLSDSIDTITSALDMLFHGF